MGFVKTQSLRTVHSNDLDVWLQRLRKGLNPGGAKCYRNDKKARISISGGAKLGKITWIWKFQGGANAPLAPPPCFATAAIFYSLYEMGGKFHASVSNTMGAIAPTVSTLSPPLNAHSTYVYFFRFDLMIQSFQKLGIFDREQFSRGPRNINLIFSVFCNVVILLQCWQSFVK